MHGDERPGATEPRRAGPARPVTMAEVGRIAGVSQVTVSRALSDPARVSPAALERIRHAIDVTGFVPNRVAGALASNRSRLVSTLVPSITNIVYSSAIKAFCEGMRARGYQILLSETGYDPADEEMLIEAHLSRRPEAMLLTGTRHSALSRRMLLAAGIPVVEIWDVTDTPIDLCVGFSHGAAAQAVAEFVAGAGYGRAATVAAGDERARRRRDAFAARYRELAGGTVAAVDFDGEASLARGREALAQLIEAGFAGGAVTCSSDLLAHGALIEAAARGLSVPGEVAVVGFGDQDFAAHTHPGLTSVRVDRVAQGSLAAEAVLARLEGGAEGPPVRDIGFQIIRRGSA